jgi:NTP pyrophosphatase (non-canonical NTP hydrolase)
MVETRRKCIERLANDMESVMGAHDNEKGTSWERVPFTQLHEGLLGEVDELRCAYNNFDSEQYRKELIDIANYCAMLAERVRMRDDRKPAMEVRKVLP